MKEILLSREVESAELAELIAKWFKRATIVVIAKCSIEYSGRASSTAREAVRLILIKQDGTILIHESSGREPLNWQPKATVSVKQLDNQEVEIIAVRRTPDEKLTVRIRGRALTTVAVLGDVGLTLCGREEDLIEEIARNPSSVVRDATLIAREVNTPYGRVDIMLKDSSGKLIVVEVKRSQASIEAAQQLHRYVEYYRRLGLEVEGVLIALDVSGQALKYLRDHGLKYLKYSAKPLSS
ncbi:MAG: endonuclease NucS [Sulfolobales archaeon]|nr:endonuclease NucS [Sulfolobales archaeon]MDW8083140.1 endonuclease NucS [Sulfolobales archaeon]